MKTFEKHLLFGRQLEEKQTNKQNTDNENMKKTRKKIANG